jgi:hypothetical protein
MRMEQLRNEQIHNLYSAPNIISVIKLWMIRWAGYVAGTEIRNPYKSYRKI